MNLADAFGILLSAFLVLGLILALIDMLIKISRQPKRKGPADWTTMSPYPLVPEMVKIKDSPNLRR